MSTMIGGAKGVDHGLVRNLQRMQARTEVTTDRALIAAFREIGKICSAMKLMDIVKKQAEEFYKQVCALRACVEGQGIASHHIRMMCTTAPCIPDHTSPRPCIVHRPSPHPAGV
jgi:transcription initiation factor TFIIIB Brf1 subunit/transcription initiation factor TFIIB